MAVSDGRRALLAVLQRTKAAHVAARLRVRPSTVTRWASGQANPTPAHAAKLVEIYGIGPFRDEKQPACRS